MAEEYKRSEGSDYAAVQVVDGWTVRRSEKGHCKCKTGAVLNMFIACDRNRALSTSSENGVNIRFLSTCYGIMTVWKTVLFQNRN